MNRANTITLILLFLMFVLTGLWKSGMLFSDDRPVDEMDAENDRSALLAFWDHYNLATGYLNDGVYDSAAVYYEKALQLNDRHEGGLYYLGNSRLLLKDFEDAEIHWQRLVEINPNSARAWLQLGTIYFCLVDGNNLFDQEIAKNYFLEAQKLNREETGPPLHLSKIAILEGRFTEAEEYTEIVMAQNFMSYQAKFLKGYLEWKKGDSPASSKTLSEAGSLFKTISQVTMAGEGATEAGFRPMLSKDMFCDFFGIRIDQLLTNRDDYPEEKIWKEFENDVDNWRLGTGKESS